LLARYYGPIASAGIPLSCWPFLLVWAIAVAVAASVTGSPNPLQITASVTTTRRYK
jgi:hypothetical protein